MDYKFRGWDVIGHKWVYGDFVHNKKVTRIGLKPRVMVGGYEVAPESVGLLLDIIDKNQKPIFVGDILRIYDKINDDESLSEVIFHQGVACIKSTIDFTDIRFFLLNEEEYEIEVVGNAYHDKELLEG